MRQASLPAFHDDVTDWRPPTPPDLSRFARVELDCETTGLEWLKGDRPVGLAVGTPAGRYYLPFGHRGGQNIDEGIVRDWARRELRNKHISNLNTKFDLHQMRVWGVDLTTQNCTFHDVSHSAALLDDHRKRFNLETLAQEVLGESKLDVFDKSNLADLPAGAVAAYAMRDVELVARLAAAYAPQLAAEDLGRVSTLEDEVIPVVVEMEKNGMPLDLDLLDTWVTESQRIYERIQWEIYRIAGFMVNPDAAKDLTRLFRQVGATPGRTATGAPSFTEDVMAEHRHIPAVNLVWRLGKLADLRSKYLLKYQAEHVNGVLYPSLNQLRSDEGGTVSGRFSCVRPNLQQVMGKDKHGRLYGWLAEYGPHDFLIKRLFRPALGQWCDADLKQCEYRIFTHYSQSARLLAMYDANPLVNFHGIVAPMVQAIRADVTKTEVKIGNFLSVFGGGISAWDNLLKCGLTKAQEMSDAYHAAFPEARETLGRAMRVAQERGFVRTLMGRRSRFKGPKWKRERAHKALNAAVQGTAADANKLALVDVYRERARLGFLLRMSVHDQMCGDLQGDPVALTEFLDQPRLPLRVKLLWDTKVGETWADAA